MTTPRLSRSRASHNGERSAGQSEAPALDLAVVIPAKDEIDNLLVLLPRLERTLAGLSIVAQTIVVVSEPDEAAEAALERLGARVIVQREAGYGSALQAGIAAANARYILTMNGDLSHSPGFIERLWQRRHAAEVVIASRYVPGGSADMPKGRYVLSRVLNAVFSRGLSLSSGFRLHNAKALRRGSFRARNFDILQEVLLQAYADVGASRKFHSTTAPGSTAVLMPES